MTKHVQPPICINVKSFEAHARAGHDLIPLHRHDAVSIFKNKERLDGKRPIDSSWTKKTYSTRAIIERARVEGNNTGVRLRADQLVLDYDPRNDPLGDSLERLSADLQLDLSQYPCVSTGSGGEHFYMTKPEDVLVRDSLEEYPGVEWKSKGRQVLCAGCIHPNTKKEYVFDELSPLISAKVAAPDSLLNIIRRPQRSGATAGGQYDQEQIATMLDVLDPEDFGEGKYEKWIRLGMACHHASDGVARSEFIEWCSRDPKYSDNAVQVGRHWDSFDVKGDDRVTYKTLNWFLKEADQGGAIPPDYADDFKDESDEEGESQSGGQDWLGKLNKKYTAVLDGGRFRVMQLEESPDLPGRRYWVSSPESDFSKYFANQFIEVPGRTKPIPLGKAWIEWAGRKSANGIAFDHKAAPASIIGNKLNLWTGWGVEPREGDCSKFKAVIRDVLCGGNQAHFEYFVRWNAWTIQNPGLPPEIAIVLQGAKGLGKGTYGETMIGIFGSHGIAVSRRDQFAGRFSGHLAMACFVFADEAVWGGNKEDEGTLKKLITDRQVTYEAKHRDATPGLNHVSLVMATNEDWAAPATFDERRFAVFNMADDKRVEMDAPPDDPNRLYWDAVHYELNHGGREAFLFEMLNTDIGDWHPRTGVPRTDALAKQVIEGLRGVDRWIYEMLMSGDLPADPVEGIPDWHSGPQRISPTVAVKDCIEWSKHNRSVANITAKGLFKKLKKIGWDRGNSGGRYWEVPALDEARRTYAKKALGGYNPFEEEDSEGA